MFTTPHPNHCHGRWSLALSYVSLSPLHFYSSGPHPLPGFERAHRLFCFLFSALYCFLHAGGKSCQSTFQILSLPWSKRKLRPMPHPTTQDSPHLGISLLSEFSPPHSHQAPASTSATMGAPLPEHVHHFPPLPFPPALPASF